MICRGGSATGGPPPSEGLAATELAGHGRSGGGGNDERVADRDCANGRSGLGGSLVG